MFAEHCGRGTWPLPVAERRAVALGDLLHLVVVSQHEESLLEFAHLFHFGHHVLVDAIHDLLRDRDPPRLGSIFYCYILGIS